MAQFTPSFHKSKLALLVAGLFTAGTLQAQTTSEQEVEKITVTGSQIKGVNIRRYATYGGAI